VSLVKHFQGGGSGIKQWKDNKKGGFGAQKEGNEMEKGVNWPAGSVKKRQRGGGKLSAQKVLLGLKNSPRLDRQERQTKITGRDGFFTAMLTKGNQKKKKEQWGSIFHNGWKKKIG